MSEKILISTQNDNREDFLIWRGIEKSSKRGIEKNSINLKSSNHSLL